MSQFIPNMFYKQRADFLKTLPERDARFSFPDGVTEECNIPYSSSPIKAHHLDIYRPSDRDGKSLPVIINVHGGGLIMGCKEFNRYFCARLCKLGYVVFNIEYRLVPDCLFFDQCTDVFTAFNYIGEHLTDYHGEPDHIYAVGDSGGACLLTYCVAMQNNPAIASAAGITPSALPIRALGLISGMFYTTKFDQIGLFLPKYLYGASYKKSSFAPYINPEHPELIKALPPCFLVTSANDNLQHYTLQFEKALTANHMPHQLLNFPANKALTHAFSVFEPFLDESTRTMQAICEYFNENR